MAKLDLSSLSLEELTDLIDEATKLRASKVDAKRQELQKQLAELDAFAKPSGSKSSSSQRKPSTFTHVHPKNGSEWLGRGGVPTAWRDIITEDMTKEQRAAELKKYRVER